MTKFIIVRHGQSKANESGYLVGCTEAPLSKLGEKQAKAVSEYILKSYKVDVIYSSPLSRACNTVKGVADALNLPIITENELREFNFGEWEGLTHEEIKNNFDNGYSKWASDPGVFIPHGGESMTQLQSRVVKKLKEIGKNEDGKTVLIGSHSSVIRALQCYIQGLPLTKMKNTPWVVNGSLAEINFDGENFFIFKYGFDGHLIDLQN
ncbi:MAG: histidine phosphatase family protein [Clostridia bacterium]|nr:histidine phosphatase family protein [Clostridia bacterium]